MKPFYLLLLPLLCSCATSGMRGGVAQAHYELRKAQETLEPAILKPETFGPETLELLNSRLNRANTVLSSWAKSYGEADRQIDDNSLYPVLEQMRSENTAISAVKDFIGRAVGDNWLTMLFGAGGAGTALIGLLLKMLQERGRRREMENAASDCAAAIEAIPDETLKRQTKDTVRKRQTSRTGFHKISQKIGNFP